MSDKLKVPVTVEALHALLSALNGPSHYITELQVTRGPLSPTNPIDVLIEDYNQWARAQKSQSSNEPQS